MTREDGILTAAAGLFAKKGFSSVGVDEIGAAAGVSGPAIYRHFSSKDEILGTLFEHGMDAIVRATAHQLDNPRAALEHMARQHALHILRDPKLSSVWINETRSLAPAHARRYRRRAGQYVRQWEEPLRSLHPGAAPDDIRAVIFGIIGALNSVASWPSALRTPEHVELVVDIALRASNVLAVPVR